MQYGGFNPNLEREHQADTDKVFGAASSPCLALIPESDREKYLPIGEVQVGRQDTMDCASRGPVNIYEAKFTWLLPKLLPANKKWLEDTGYVQNGRVTFSDAFIAILSGTTRSGNSLKAPLQTIHEKGLIPKKLLPLDPSMLWDEYMNPARITQEMRDIGEEFLRRFTLRYDRVDAAIECDDYTDNALFAWPNPVNGEYPRTEEPFNHVVVKVRKPRHTVFDNYIDRVDGDYIKKLAPDYLFYDYGYRCYISAEHDPADRAIQLTVFETLKKYGLLSYFADWWDRFTRSVRGFLDPGSLGAARSPKWSSVRKAFLALHPLCAACGAKSTLLKPNEAHHQRPFHLDPSLELQESNLITLCRPCHLLIGHLKSWSSFNQDVSVDARIIRDKIKNRP